MADLRTAAQQALEALRGYRREMQEHQPCDAEVALEAALAEPVQEPVAWMMVNKTHNLGPSLHWQPQTDWHITWEAVPLYTHPPRRLTDDQIGQIWFAAKIPGLTESDARRLIRVAEEAK